jgi:hypothetical protein
MPNNLNNINFVSESNNNYVTIRSNNGNTQLYYITDSTPIVGCKTFTTKTSYAPEIWETPDNPYFEYVSELKNLTKNLKIKNNQVFVDDEYASYRKLAEVIQCFINAYNRYKKIKVCNEPETKGDEFNE